MREEDEHEGTRSKFTPWLRVIEHGREFRELGLI